MQRYQHIDSQKDDVAFPQQAGRAFTDDRVIAILFEPWLGVLDTGCDAVGLEDFESVVLDESFRWMSELC